MEVFEWIRFIIGTAVLLCGLVIFVIEIYGIFHLRYVLNRMHAAAMGDTLGISISLIGLMIFSGLNFTTLKMALIIVFLWNASPVSSHLIARLEATTNPHLERCCELEEGVMEHLWDEDQREIIYADQKKKNADKVDQNKVNHDKAIQHKAEEET